MIKILLFLLLTACTSMGQSYPRREVDVQELLVQWTLAPNDDQNYEEIYENLYQVYQNSLDLNVADRDELSVLLFLSEKQITELLAHRQRFGPYLSLYELQALEGFTLEDVRQLLPFVTVRQGLGDLRPKGLLRRADQHYFLFRADRTLEPRRGFTEGQYAGSPLRYYTRYRLSRAKDFSVGFISEKDAGEKNFFDYTAFHVQLQNKGWLRNMVAGDYLLQFGQGLVFSAGYAAGKGGEPVYTTRRSNLGIKPYNSLVENGGFRGMGMTWQLGRIEWTGMYSFKRKDASGTDEVASLLTAGLHRTAQEISGQKAISEQNIGGNIGYRGERLRVGFSFLATRFDRVYGKRDLPYNFYEFRGEKNAVWGPNFFFSRENFSFFGELARSASGGYGYVGGLVGALGRQTEVSLNFRNYGKNFHTLYGSGFAEGGRTINEQGAYAGLKYRIKKGWELAGYYDIFRFPWLRYRVDAPSSGHDFQLRMNYRPGKRLYSWVAFRGDAKWRNPGSSTAAVRAPVPVLRQAGILSVDYIPGLHWKFQSKLQHNVFRSQGSGTSRGWALIQDVETRSGRMQFKMRVAAFRTDSYDTRIYAYENDVLYAVSFPAYYGRGFRWYGIVKLPLGNAVEVWLRTARTRVTDRETLGSGPEEIDGNTKTDVRIQVKYSL